MDIIWNNDINVTISLIYFAGVWRENQTRTSQKAWLCACVWVYCSRGHSCLHLHDPPSGSSDEEGGGAREPHPLGGTLQHSHQEEEDTIQWTSNCCQRHKVKEKFYLSIYYHLLNVCENCENTLLYNLNLKEIMLCYNYNLYDISSVF